MKSKKTSIIKHLNGQNVREITKLSLTDLENLSGADPRLAATIHLTNYLDIERIIDPSKP